MNVVRMLPLLFVSLYSHAMINFDGPDNTILSCVEYISDPITWKKIVMIPGEISIELFSLGFLATEKILHFTRQAFFPGHYVDGEIDDVIVVGIFAGAISSLVFFKGYNDYLITYSDCTGIVMICMYLYSNLFLLYKIISNDPFSNHINDAFVKTCHRIWPPVDEEVEFVKKISIIALSSGDKKCFIYHLPQDIIKAILDFLIELKNAEFLFLDANSQKTCPNSYFNWPLYIG